MKEPVLGTKVIFYIVFYGVAVKLVNLVCYFNIIYCKMGEMWKLGRAAPTTDGGNFFYSYRSYG